MKKLYTIILLVFISNFGYSYTKAELLNLPYKRTDYYGKTFSTNLIEKIKPFEGNAAKYLKDIDNYTDYKNHELTEDETAFFLECFSCLPEKLQDSIIKNVFAIYFIEGMWYGAMTDYVFDDKQNVLCNLYFNIDTFDYTLTDWIEYRDNTIFSDSDEKNMIKVECSNEWTAFIQVLMHEAVHVYDYVNNITPDLYGIIETNNKESQFFNVWKNKNQPAKKYQNKWLDQTSFYYFGNQISIKHGKEIVDYLSSTPFSTLYGAKNWLDDFAETVTFYYLQKKYGINYKLTFIENGKEKATYNLKNNQNIKIWFPLCKSITGL